MRPREFRSRCYSTRSFARAAAVDCHCIFSGVSVPPCFSVRTWSITEPGHAKVDDPVAGQGCSSLNARRILELRLIRPLGMGKRRGAAGG